MSRINKSQQLRDLIDYFAKGNNSEFARILGMSPQGVSTWLSRGNFDIELIYSKCEGLNPEWLLTGEGDMLKENFFFKTKTPENVVKENDHNNDHNNDHKRKLRKTWSNKQYKITGSTPPIAAENQVPYQASRSQQGKGRIIDSSYLEIEIPPERRGIRNMFSGFTDEEIEELASKIRKMKEDGTHLCCSIGFLTEKQALMLKEAGLDRINHNLNSSRAYYSHICSTHTFEQRVQNIKMLQGLGFEICSGGIIGMGESKEDVVDMLLELREIQPEALPINFLLPIPGTPLGDADISELTTEYCMKVLCLARLLVPQSDIRCAAGREVYFKGEEKKLLSVVDSIFASGYLTADGQGIKDTIRTITDAGFTYEIESA